MAGWHGNERQVRACVSARPSPCGSRTMSRHGLLEMDRDGVVKQGLDLPRLQMRLQLVAPLGRDYEQMVGMPFRRARRRQDPHPAVVDAGGVASSDLPPSLHPGRTDMASARAEWRRAAHRGGCSCPARDGDSAPTVRSCGWSARSAPAPATASSVRLHRRPRRDSWSDRNSTLRTPRNAPPTCRRVSRHAPARNPRSGGCPRCDVSASSSFTGPICPYRCTSRIAFVRGVRQRCTLADVEHRCALVDVREHRRRARSQDRKDAGKGRHRRRHDFIARTDAQRAQPRLDGVEPIADSRPRAQNQSTAPTPARTPQPPCRGSTSPI